MKFILADKKSIIFCAPNHRLKPQPGVTLWSWFAAIANNQKTVKCSLIKKKEQYLDTEPCKEMTYACPTKNI